MERWMQEGALDLARTQPWDQTMTVTHLFEAQALDPTRLALVAEGGQRTFGELRSFSRRCAHALVALGVADFDRVGVLLGNRLEFIEIEGGISGARAIMVGMNWRLTPRELQVILDKSQPRVVFAEAPYIHNILGLRAAGTIPYVETVIDVGGSAGDLSYDALLDRGIDAPPPRTGLMHEPHEIIFTSGTTGVPKGAVWTHGSVIWNSIQQVMDYRIDRRHSTYVMIDLFYVGGRHDLTFAMLQQGGTVHIKPSGNFDAGQVLDYIERHAITHLLWVPSMLHEVLPRIASNGHAPPSIRFIMSGGAPLPLQMIEEAGRLFPDAEFAQVYGLTEGGGSVTYLPLDDAKAKIGSCGRPSRHVSIRVVRPDGATCPPGEAGEILMRGPSQSAGYWGLPERTDETIVDGWLYTGDIGYFDEDGFLFISGRRKEMIISGGMNIFPAEIEEALLLHPDIDEAAVVGLPDEKWGEHVAAFVRLHEGRTVAADAIIAHCRQMLSSYKKPKQVFFVDELPRTISGKVRKTWLKERTIAAGTAAEGS